MHDIRAIRENPELYEKHWAAKGLSGRVADLLDLDGKLRAAQTALQAAQAERNESSKKIGQAKARKDEDEAVRATPLPARPAQRRRRSCQCRTNPGRD